MVNKLNDDDDNDDVNDASFLDYPHSYCLHFHLQNEK